jgi:hypothetical protein
MVKHVATLISEMSSMMGQGRALGIASIPTGRCKTL